MIKVLITDDHPVVRRGIRQILEDEERIGLIHEAGNGKELFDKLKEQEYDVILLDISLPGRSGLDLISQIKKMRPSAAILMLSIHSEEMYAINALKCGALGYLTKSSAPEELVSAIFKVSKGERYISSSLADKMADSLLSETEKPLHQLLSAREMEVLNLFAAGKTVVQIASDLSLSPKTISTYRERLLEKLKLHTTADLIRYAIMEEITGQK
ncbi:MAG: response regulator transcription factor [Bacteroidales bacterium]|jgi:DNA-binding NarL/FixJ family response regulator